jgi:hypothetical protein
MSRSLRVTLGVVALALVTAGTVVGRAGTAWKLSEAMGALARLREPLRADLEARLADIVPVERLGEALLGVGLAAWVLLGARSARTSIGFAVAAAIVALAAAACGVFYPTARLPERAYVRPPNSTWPYSAVETDKAFWNVFVVRTPKNEWGVLIEHSNPTGPEGLKNTLVKLLGEAAGKKPVRLYEDLSCPEDLRKVFLDAAHAAADPAQVEVDDRILPDPADLNAIVRQREDERLAPFRDTVQLGILAHLSSALALALVVWWVPRNVRGAGVVTGGNLLMAFGQAVALPISLYVAMKPDEPGYPEFRRLATHIQPHLWIALASSAALVVGALVAAVGNTLVLDSPPAPPRKPLQQPRLPEKREKRDWVDPKAPPAEPAATSPTGPQPAEPERPRPPEPPPATPQPPPASPPA